MSAPTSVRFVARRRLTSGLAALSALALLPALATVAPPASAEPDAAGRAAAAPATGVDHGSLGDPVAGLLDIDPEGVLEPLTAQVDAADALGVSSVRWGRLGTPTSLLPDDGSLGSVGGDPETAARSWLEDNAAPFGLEADQMAGLELVNVQRFARGSTPSGGTEPSAGAAVLFRQTLDGLAPARDGLVTVGVARGEVAYVSSSLARLDVGAGVASGGLDPAEGWLAAALSVRPTLDLGLGELDVTEPVDGGPTDFTTIAAPGFAQAQQARLRYLAVADPTDGVELRPVVEANVVDVDGAETEAYTVLVDAADGDVLSRVNQVDNAVYNNVFTGQITANDCGPEHEFELTDGATRTINLIGQAAPVDDITVKLFDPNGELLVDQDLLTSPEVATYSPAGRIPAGVYTAQVCPFDAASVVVGAYALTVSTNDTESPGGGGGSDANPRWRYFTANPAFDSLPTGTVPQNSVVGCWVDATGCTTPTGSFDNVADPYKWDELVGPNGAPAPTLTTVGNNANTHEAWGSPLTPGGLAQAPYSPTREYTAAFTDAWNESGCSPTELVPGGNDIEASVGNLFVAHNRMHDYGYYLGFTEDNYNLQLSNFSNGGVPGDQEIGNAQAGATSGGAPSYLGRDNANQVTLQDGVPGITNQYLFQSIAGAFYAPCADGGLDMGIVGHEYTHAISNRMVAGPDEGLTSEHGGAMGESWSDLVAGEYMFSHGYENGGNPWAIGAYATGNADVAIRDYAINRNPLNFSDYGFDTTGPEVHADGEIWNATQWAVRQALVRRYRADFPYRNADLQLRCAQGRAKKSPLAALYCPGNRRWVTLMFDSFLLQQGATSMLDARDAMIAADRMRFRGANLDVIWDAYARQGMGGEASTPSADSEDVVPSFASPRSRNGTIRFAGAPGSSIYVGDYEARVTPVADAVRSTDLGRSARFTPGRYRLLQVTPGGGFRRFAVRVAAGSRQTVRLSPRVDLASEAAGGSVIEATDGSLAPESLLDGTEDTSWAWVDDADSVDDVAPSVSVDLAGGVHRIDRVQVSALLNPVDGDDDPDPASGSRFTALRRFAIEVCRTGCDGASATWRRVLTSAGDAFPGRRPRPVAPDQTLRGFGFDAVRASAVRLVALENQCTGFAGYAGEQDSDPLNATDCKDASDADLSVRAAELQVFGPRRG